MNDTEVENEKTLVFKQEEGAGWTAYHGDACEVTSGIPDDFIDISIYSPPFAALYVYSDSPRDMGNAASYEEFCEHYQFLLREIYRATKPGRLSCVHCMDLPTTKSHHGRIGIQDFRGDIIRAHEAEGWIYHSAFTIWKDPVVAMQRTKAIGLLHKQLVKDSSISRQGIPDYVLNFVKGDIDPSLPGDMMRILTRFVMDIMPSFLVAFRKPGENAEPIAGELDHFVGDKDTFKNDGRLSIDIWQRYASPIWMDINPSNTLQKNSARDDADERHIAPLQLDVIERLLQLWSNPGDMVFSPFGGIGSEPYSALLAGRRAIAIELKESYFKQLVANCRIAEAKAKETRLFV